MEDRPQWPPPIRRLQNEIMPIHMKPVDEHIRGTDYSFGAFVSIFEAFFNSSIKQFREMLELLP